MWSKIIFSGASEVVSPPVALNLSPSRDGTRLLGRHAVNAWRGRPSLGRIIASPRLSFHPGNTCISTTKRPGAARDPDLCGGTFDGQVVPTPKKPERFGCSPRPKSEDSRMESESWDIR